MELGSQEGKADGKMISLIQECNFWVTESV